MLLEEKKSQGSQRESVELWGSDTETVQYTCSVFAQAAETKYPRLGGTNNGVYFS